MNNKHNTLPEIILTTHVDHNVLCSAMIGQFLWTSTYVWNEESITLNHKSDGTSETAM